MGIEPNPLGARRRDAKIRWTEVDADTGRETGQSVPGQRDCADGNGDPLSPVNPDLRIIRDRASQLRLVPRSYLNRSGSAAASLGKADENR